MKVPPEIASLIPYQPGKPISETKRELGLTEVIKLASNESPLGPSQKVLQAIQAALPEIHRYPDGACFEMRQALAHYYDVPTDELIFGNGSDELVDMLVQIYCRNGEAILTSKGAFSAYEISARSVLVRPLHTPMTADLRFDLKAMATLLKQDKSIRMVFLANPNNPTGTYFTHAEFSEFMQVAGQQDVLVVLDEAYIEFVRAPDFPKSREFQKRYTNVLSLRTLSKVFGLAGLRVGILIAPPEICAMVNRVRKPFNINSLAQAGACAAVADREYVQRLKQITWDGLDYYYQQLQKMGLEYCPSQGNFVLLNTGQDGELVYQALLRQGVILRPVKGYGFPTHLRMSVGLEPENAAAIKALQKVLTKG